MIKCPRDELEWGQCCRPCDLALGYCRPSDNTSDGRSPALGRSWSWITEASESKTMDQRGLLADSASFWVVRLTRMGDSGEAAVLRQEIESRGWEYSVGWVWDAPTCLRDAKEETEEADLSLETRPLSWRKPPAPALCLWKVVRTFSDICSTGLDVPFWLMH